MPRRVLEPLAFALFLYVFVFARSGQLPSFSPLVAVVVLAISFGGSELFHLLGDGYAELHSEALFVHKLRSRYEPRGKYIAYTDILRIERRRDGTLTVWYAGFTFLTRRPGERPEVFRPAKVDRFLDALEAKISLRTGGVAPIR